MMARRSALDQTHSMVPGPVKWLNTHKNGMFFFNLHPKQHYVIKIGGKYAIQKRADGVSAFCNKRFRIEFYIASLAAQHTKLQ